MVLCSMSFHIGVQIFEPFGGGFDFVFADARGAKQNLPLKIAGADDIDIRQADGADTRGGKIQARSGNPARPRRCKARGR